MPVPKYSFGTPMRKAFALLARPGNAYSLLVASCGASLPQIAPNKSATSSTVRPNGPIWSSEDANATSPKRDTAPYVGLSPTMPQSPAGQRMEPPVSEPSESGTSLAATHAALPPDEPPGTREVSHGFLVGLKYEFSHELPMANSSILSLPGSTAPAASSFSTTVAL